MSSIRSTSDETEEKLNVSFKEMSLIPSKVDWENNNEQKATIQEHRL